MAVVAATALHNHRAARADTFNVLAVTTRDGKQHQFATQKSLSPLAPLYDAYRKAGVREFALRRRLRLRLALPRPRLLLPFEGPVRQLFLCGELMLLAVPGGHGERV